MSIIEWAGFVTGVICVYLIVIEKDSNWPIGVINSVILLYIFWQQKLWATVGLQTFYTFECLYGWYMWTRKDRYTGMKLIRIGNTPIQMALWLMVAGIVGVTALTFMLRKTGDPYPFFDALVGVGSLIAEYLLCLKMRQAWALYFLLDLISLVVLALLGSWITFGTYVVFTFLCVLGIMEWRRRYLSTRNATEIAANGETSAAGAG